MKRFVTSTLCRLLIVLMAWSPFQMAQASMIGTGQIVANQAQSDRSTVLNFLERQDVAGQLQSLGTDAASAKDRVNAMTDQEVSTLARNIQAMPAGADSHSWRVLLVLVIIGAVIWWAAGRPGMTGR
jgi:hypothetical protein